MSERTRSGRRDTYVRRCRCSDRADLRYRSLKATERFFIIETLPPPGTSSVPAPVLVSDCMERPGFERRRSKREPGLACVQRRDAPAGQHRRARR